MNTLFHCDRFKEFPKIEYFCESFDNVWLKRRETVKVEKKGVKPLALVRWPNKKSGVRLGIIAAHDIIEWPFEKEGPKFANVKCGGDIWRAYVVKMDYNFQNINR